MREGILRHTVSFEEVRLNVVLKCSVKVKESKRMSRHHADEIRSKHSHIIVTIS